MKEIMKELGIFTSEFRENQAVSDDIQTITSLIKYELQNPIRNIMSQNKTKIKYFGWTVMEYKNIDYEPTEKKNRENKSTT